MIAMQCKMARVALGLGVRELAEAAKVSPDTIARLERGEELKPRTVEAIQAALETAGVIFVEENGEGPGVRMRKIKSGDIVRLRQAGHIAGIALEQGQTGIVMVVELDTEHLGSKYRLTVRFGDNLLLPLAARDVELVSPRAA